MHIHGIQFKVNKVTLLVLARLYQYSNFIRHCLHWVEFACPVESRLCYIYAHLYKSTHLLYSRFFLFFHYYRGRISSSGQVKLAIFTTLYCISFVIVFIYERVVSINIVKHFPNWGKDWSRVFKTEVIT